MTIIRIGLDTAKHVFQVHGVDENEQTVDGLIVILNIKWRVVFERMRRSPRRFCRHDVLIRFPVRQSFLSA